MACQGADSVKLLFTEANKIAPNRNKASDGICASQQHHQQNPSSDHEGDPRGIAHAGDLTHDPANDWDAHKRSDQTVARRDRRIKYRISRRRITSYYAVGSYPPWADRPYHGANTHELHAHTSIRGGVEYEKDLRPWWPESEEDELAGVGDQILAEVQQLRVDVDALQKSAGALYPGGPSIQKALVKYAPLEEGGPNVPQEHLNIINDRLDELTATLGELADAFRKLAEQHE